MESVTLCDNDRCPVKDKCLRANAIPNPFYQLTETFFYDMKKQKCDHFIERSYLPTDEQELN